MERRRVQELWGNYEYHGFGEDHCMFFCVYVCVWLRVPNDVTLISREILRINVTQSKHVGQKKPIKQHFRCMLISPWWPKLQARWIRVQYIHVGSKKKLNISFGTRIQKNNVYINNCRDRNRSKNQSLLSSNNRIDRGAYAFNSRYDNIDK